MDKIFAIFLVILAAWAIFWKVKSERKEKE